MCQAISVDGQRNRGRPPIRTDEEILRAALGAFAADGFDAMSVRIAESLGFEVGMFAGSTGSATVLGAPDIIVMTLTEFADQILRICRASALGSRRRVRRRTDRGRRDPATARRRRSDHIRPIRRVR